MRLRERLFPSLLALEFFLSLLQLLDAFQVWYFPMKHRLLYSLRFDLGFSLVPFLLPVAFVVLAILLLRGDHLGVFISSVVTLFVHFYFGFEAAVAIFSLIQVVLAMIRFIDLGEFLFWFLVLITGFEALALIHWVVYPLGLFSPFNWFAKLEMDLFYIVGSLAPYIFAIILIFVLFDFLRKIPRIKDFYNKLQILKILREVISYTFKKKEFSGHNISESCDSNNIKNIFLLFFVICLGVIAAIYPYSNAINPENFDVGVDIPYYVNHSKIIEKNVFLALNDTQRSRTIILFTIYGFQRLLDLDVLTAVRYMPIFLNPLLAITAFFFTSEIFSNTRLGLWAAFFTICGFQITVGMYSHILANMLGLCFIYTSLGFLFKSIRKDKKIYLLIASLFGVLLIFTHTWTSVQYFTSLLITLIIMYFKINDKKTFKIMLIYFIILFFAEILKIFIFHGYSAVSASAMVLIRSSGLFNFWHNNITVFRALYGGIMSNLILLILTIVGIVFLYNSSVAIIYLKTFIIINFTVILFSDARNISRILYNMPIGLLSSLGHALLFFNMKKEKIKKIGTLLIILINVIYLFRSIANFI